MASVVANTVGQSLRRNSPSRLGAGLTAGQVVQFSIPPTSMGMPGIEYLTITATGTGTVALEGSLDGGTTWFGIVAVATQLNATTLNSDVAVGSANAFNVSGLHGALFRAGGAIGDVWVLLG